MKVFLLSIILACAISGATAQERSRAVVPSEVKNEADLVTDPDLKELTGLLGDPDVTCRKKVFVAAGTISRLYLNDGGKTLSAFEITGAKNKRYPINLNNDPFGAVGTYSFATIKGVFRKGRKAVASYVICQENPSAVFDSYYLAKITVE